MIVAKYKFDKSIYSNLIPVFNDGYEGYTVSDEIDNTNSNHIIRTIECDVLPTKIDFGVGGNEEQYTNRSDSLLAIYNLDTSAVTDGNRIVKGCRYMTEINTSDWDTSNMVDMSGMFGYCDKLTSIDVSNFNTNNVKYINAMFYDCNQLTSLDVSNFNTSNVTDMSYMFGNCRNLTSLDVSNFNTSNVTNMQSMFDNCNNLTSLDVSNWDTKNVADMNAMFCDCTNLTSLDVSNFDTSNVTDIGWMFGGCQKLTSLDVSDWDTSNVTDMSGMFNSCHNLLSLDVSRWNTSKVKDMNNMFNFCYLLGNIDLSNWDTSNVKYVNGMFGRCRQMTIIDISNFDMSAIKTTNEDNYYHMFTEISNVKTLIFGNNKFPDDVDFIKLFGDDTPPSLEKIIVLEENTVNKLTDVLPDCSSELPGVIVTNATISDEAISTISSKNWSIRKMVAQYRYDANTYENLIPEFNTEFSSDKYEIYDSVSEIVIDNIQWEEGSIDSITGDNYNSPAGIRLRSVQYLRVIPNIQYNFSYDTNIRWYDENKKIISEASKHTNTMVSPSNAKYLRIYQGEGTTDLTISAKLITRSIESKNGDLPTQMYFGNLNATTSYYTGGFWSSLLKVYGIITSSLTTMRGLFRWCDRLTSIDGMSAWDTSNVVDMGYLFDCCYSITSLDVSNFNTSNVTTMNHMFNINNNSLTSLDVSGFDTKNVTSMGSMFANCNGLAELDVSNWDTSKVTNMSTMFYRCTNLTSLDVSNWDTKNVNNMSSMFYNCTKLTSLDVSGFDTSNVTTMQSVFNGCNNLTSLDVSNFDTSNVTNMHSMFLDCNNLLSLDVSNFDTSNVTTMYAMFQDCNNLLSLDVSNFDTSNVTNMGAIFSGCNNLTSLDVSNWDTGEVIDMRSMFYFCSSLTSLDVSRWNTGKATTMKSMFWKCKNIKHLNLNNWNFDKVTDMSCMISTNAGMKMLLESLDMTNSEINTSTDTSILFYMNDASLASIKTIRCSNINTITNVLIPNLPTRSIDNKGQIITSAELTQDIIDTLTSKNWTVVSDNTLTKVVEYVYDSNTWNSIIPEFNKKFVDYFIDDVENENGLVTRTISSLGELPTTMIFGVKYPNSITWKEKSLYNVNYIDTSNLISANEMFRYCMNLISINTANWDTSKITNMCNMFFNCNKLTSLDVSNFNTSNVTNMSYMFCNCQKLTSLDLSNFDTSNAKYMQYIFNDCYNLTSLDVSNFNTSNVTDMRSMFANTSKLLDIGMLYCTPSTINTIVSNLPTTHTQTIWVQDTKPNECTVVSGVEFKEYKENGVVVNLSSPLLQGDRIEVKDGKLCHYHKMGKVVLDGSENWVLAPLTAQLAGTDINTMIFRVSDNSLGVNINSDTRKSKSNNFMLSKSLNLDKELLLIGSRWWSTDPYTVIRIRRDKLSTQDVNGFKQWLSVNPTIAVYELAEPYYEDITPIQSNLTLETYLECNLDIYTDLPIKTNLTYLTNITNTSSIEEDINTINEGTDLTNLLEDEINN